MPKKASNSIDPKVRQDVPRWRLIEIMREKAQLHEALGDLDFDSDFDEVDEEVFGSDEEYMSFHEHCNDFDEDEDLEEPDDSGVFDDDFDDLDED